MAKRSKSHRKRPEIIEWEKILPAERQMPGSPACFPSCMPSCPPFCHPVCEPVYKPGCGPSGQIVCRPVYRHRPG